MSRYSVFDSFQDSILVVDAEGHVCYGNPAAAIMLQVSARRLSASKHFSNFVTFDPPLIDEAHQIKDVYEASQVREFHFHLPSGSEGWTQITLQKQPEFFAESEATKDRWICYFRDVSLEKALSAKYRAELDQKEVVIEDLKKAREALEDYSKTLEQKVEARTVELRQANGLLKTILDSLGQGILVFDQTGNCLPIFSQVCRKILGADPAGQNIEDVLSLDAKDRKNFESWREAIFEELLDFEDMVPLSPVRNRKQGGLEVEVSYNPLRGADGKLQGVVLVATDKTQEMAAVRKAEREREVVNKVTQVARNREAFRLFVGEARRLLKTFLAPASLDLEDVARQLHTLKGGAASFSIMSVAHSCHELEDELRALPQNGEGREAFNESLSKKAKETIKTLEKELVELTELLGSLGLDGQNQTIEMPAEVMFAWSRALTEVSKLEQAHQVAVEIWRECTEKPVDTAVRYLGTSLVDLAKSMGKQLAEFKIEGSSTKIPSGFGQGLMASLVHAFRNCVYHGLESPEERRAKGKNPGGSIVVAFARKKEADKEWLHIDIRDDGKGVATDKVRAKLQSLGQTKLAEASDDQVNQAILLDDLSTADKVDQVAGRGVGMSAIAAEARALGGSVVVKSEQGKGMLLEIRVPVPAAVLPFKAAA